MILTQIQINGKSVKEHIAATKQAIAKGYSRNTKSVIRNEVLRMMSDFIVYRSRILDKVTNKIISENDKFANRAAPDAQFNTTQLAKALGLESSELSDVETSTLEIKQAIGNEDFLTSLTSFTLQPEQQALFEQTYGLTATKKEGENRLTYIGTKIVGISSDELKQVVKRLGLEPILMSRISNKFNNLLYIDYLDKRHNNKPRVTLAINPLKILNIYNIDSPYIVITARPRSGSLKKISIELGIKLSEAGKSLALEKSYDITEKFHRELGRLFAQRFISYAVKKLSAKKRLTEQILTEIISLADEFAEGSHTPIEYVSVFKSNKQDTYKQNLSIVDKKTVDKSKKKQNFISNVQWTVLTQKRLGETMKRLGKPEPPDIKERSGRFRASVEVTVNYRSNLLSYTYNPLYRVLEHYGYHPELQVERALREVAQKLYDRHFSITRQGSIA